MGDGYGFCPYCECDSSEEVSMGDLFLTHSLVQCKKCYRLFVTLPRTFRFGTSN